MEKLLTVSNLVAWLRTQPADETYCYDSNGHCLVARFLKSIGVSADLLVGTADFYVFNSRSREYGPNITFPPSFNEIAFQHPRTFGAALTRAIRRLPKRHKTDISIFCEMLKTQTPLIEHQSAVDTCGNG